jgi:hypothetical protein
VSLTFLSLSDVGTAQLVEQSEENFNNASTIIGGAFKSDLRAVEEVESYLNQKCVFLDVVLDRLHWEQDHEHDQTRYHFVLAENRERKELCQQRQQLLWVV